MILCDREADLAMDLGRILIRPRPGPLFMDSTAIDLRLDGILDRWEFPAPKTGLGQKPPMFCPGDKDFKFSDIEKEFTKQIAITAKKGHELQPSFRSTPETGPRHFILG
jgi:hypothetical protein